ncbi:DUF5988 family protein [Streptomyces sp. NPDC053499]|uniref:DUF5988 family protein n=1 Tax=Streptomyces sp. NPDC053499 TaxID=3365707 RepID=UPI0037D1934A
MDPYLRVVLKGGPDSIPRIVEVAPGEEEPQVKVLRGNGYEHFEFTREYEEHDGQELPVYRWCYRTFIAE